MLVFVKKCWTTPMPSILFKLVLASDLPNPVPDLLFQIKIRPDPDLFFNLRSDPILNLLSLM